MDPGGTPGTELRAWLLRAWPQQELRIGNLNMPGSALRRGWHVLGVQAKSLGSQ